MKEKIIELIANSVITQSLLTLIIWGAILYLYLMKIDVDIELISAGMLILGYWFGTKQQQAMISLMKHKE